MNIYAEKNYRKIFRQVVEERKPLDPRVNFQKLADFARMPKSYLSKILQGNANLNSDQLFQICDYLEMNKDEKVYMGFLLEYERSVVKKRKDLLLEEIEAFRKRYLDSKEYLSSTMVEAKGTDLQEYYLEPLSQLVHSSLMIPRYQGNIPKLALDLGFPLKRVHSMINRLEKMGFVKREGQQIIAQEIHLHFPRETSFYLSARNLAHLAALNKMENLPKDETYSFWATFTATEEVKKKIQTKILEMIKESQNIIAAAPSEETYQLIIDLFSWTK